MDGYKHYVRVDVNNIVTFCYSDAFPEIAIFQAGDICIDENSTRQFNLQIINSDGEYIYKYANDQMVERTADELFDLAKYKQDKIDLLSATCNSTILAGFSSSALGISHNYDFNYEAQGNLSGRLGLINANQNYTEPFSWKTTDAGVLNHTKAQFIQLCTDADTFKNTQIAKYWTLKGQVNAVSESATSKDQIDAINW
jgi:hypothetical protein